MKSRTWFGNENHNNYKRKHILRRMTPNRVASTSSSYLGDASAGESWQNLGDEEKEFRAFVEEKRRNGMATTVNERKSTRSKYRGASTGKIKTIAASTSCHEEERMSQIHGDKGINETAQAQPKRLLQRQRLSRPRLYDGANLSSDSGTGSSIGNRPVGKPESLLMRNTSVGESGGRSIRNPSTSRSMNKLCSFERRCRRSQRVYAVSESTTDTMRSETDASAPDSIKTSHSSATATFSSILSPYSEESAATTEDNTLSSDDYVQYKDTTQSSSSTQDLERKRSSSIFITSLLRDASRKSQRNTIRKSDTLSKLDSEPARARTVNSWGHLDTVSTSIPSTKVKELQHSKEMDARIVYLENGNQRWRTRESRSVSADVTFTVQSESQLSKDRPPCLRTSLTSLASEENPKRTCRSPSTQKTAFSASTRSIYDCSTTRNERRRGFQGYDSCRRETPNTNQKYLRPISSSRNTSSGKRSPEEIVDPYQRSRVTEEEQEFAQWMDNKRRWRGNTRRGI